MQGSAGPEKIKILVLFGGRSGEHEVSLMSASSVLEALDLGLYEPLQVGIDHQGTWLWSGSEEGTLHRMQSGDRSGLVPVTLLPSPDGGKLYEISATDGGRRLNLISEVEVVFPVLHGSFGEDGCLQGFLELADLAYVGAGVLGSSLGMDKGIFKAVMKSEGIPVVESMVVLRDDISDNLDNLVKDLERISPYPLFVKPANLGSSVGVSKCRNRADLVEGLMEAARFDRRILIERGVNAREIEVSVLGNEQPVASVSGEVLPSREFYSYESKYLDGTSGLVIPAQIPVEISQKIKEYALRAYQAIDCSGMARVDFLLDKTDESLYLNEVNTIPGFTQISMYSKLWDASGVPYPELVKRLIELAFLRKVERDKNERRFSG